MAAPRWGGTGVPFTHQPPRELMSPLINAQLGLGWGDKGVGRAGELAWKPELELMLQLSVTLLFMSLEAFYDGNIA